MNNRTLYPKLHLCVSAQREAATRIDDGSGYTTWAYDDRGRVTEETKVINGAGTFKTQWSYDAMDRVVSMTYVRNNPLRYTDPTGLFVEDQLKEWFPDHRKLWREEYPWYWQMLLEADFGDIVSADWDTFVGYFHESEPGGLPVICSQGGGGCQPLTTWGRRSFVAHNEKGEYGQVYSYVLIRRDEERHVTEVLQFGNHSVKWQCDGAVCDVRTRYLGWEWVNPFTDNDVLDSTGASDTIGLLVGLVTNLAKLAFKKGNVPTIIPGVGTAWMVYDTAKLLEDIFTDDKVTTSRYRWINWSVAPYRPK